MIRVRCWGIKFLQPAADLRVALSLFATLPLNRTDVQREGVAIADAPVSSQPAG